MFKFKYEIELITSEKIFLFGEDYYNDKKFFWEMHRFKILELCEKIQQTGFPIKIKDLQLQSLIKIKSIQELKDWLKENQPFQNMIK